MNSATSSEPDHGIQLWPICDFIISLMGGVVLIASFIAMCIICCKKKKKNPESLSNNRETILDIILIVEPLMPGGIALRVT